MSTNETNEKTNEAPKSSGSPFAPSVSEMVPIKSLSADHDDDDEREQDQQGSSWGQRGAVPTDAPQMPFLHATIASQAVLKGIDLTEAVDLCDVKLREFAPFMKAWPNTLDYLVRTFVKETQLDNLDSMDQAVHDLFEWAFVVMQAHKEDVTTDSANIERNAKQLRIAFMDFLREKNHLALAAHRAKPFFPMTYADFNFQLREFFSMYQDIFALGEDTKTKQTSIILAINEADEDQREFIDAVGGYQNRLVLNWHEDQHVLGELANHILNKGPGKTHYIPYIIPDQNKTNANSIRSFKVNRVPKPEWFQGWADWFYEWQQSFPDNNAPGHYLMSMRLSRKQNPVLHWWMKFPGRIALVFSFIQLFPVLLSLFVSGFAIFTLRSYQIWSETTNRVLAFMFAFCSLGEIVMLIIIFAQLFTDVWLCIKYAWIWETDIERKLIASCCKNHLLLDLGWFLRTTVCIILLLVTLSGTSFRTNANVVGATARWQFFVEASLITGFVLYIMFLTGRVIKNFKEMYQWVNQAERGGPKFVRFLTVIRFKQQGKSDVCATCSTPVFVSVWWLLIAPIMFGVVFALTGTSAGGLVLLIMIPYLSYMVWCFRAWYARSDKAGFSKVAGDEAYDKHIAIGRGLTSYESLRNVCCGNCAKRCKEGCDDCGKDQAPRLAVLMVFSIFLIIIASVAAWVANTALSEQSYPYTKSSDLGAYPVCASQTWFGGNIQAHIGDIALFSWAANPKDWDNRIGAINKAFPPLKVCSAANFTNTSITNGTNMTCTEKPFWILQKETDRSKPLQYIHFTDHAKTVNIISIRSANVLTDVELFWNIFTLQVLSYFIPVLKLWPDSTTQEFVFLAGNFQEYVNPRASLNFYREVEDYTKTVLSKTGANTSHPLYLMGHSFGGAIAHIVATRIREKDPDLLVESIGVNSPGIHWSSKKFGISNFRVIDKTTFTLRADRALYSRIDEIVGTKASIRCANKLNARECQSMPPTLCELFYSCGASSISPLANATYYDCVCKNGPKKC